MRSTTDRIKRRLGAAVVVSSLAVAPLIALPGQEAAANADFRQGSLAVARNADGRLEAFATDASDKLWFRAQTQAGSNTWTDWEPFADPGAGAQSRMRSVAVEANEDGRLELWGVKGDGRVFHRWKTSQNCDCWSLWELVPTPQKMSSVTLARNGDGRLEVFTTDTTDNVHHMWQTSKNVNNWGGWKPYGGQLHSIAAEANENGAIELWGINGSGQTFHRWKTVANANDGWSLYEQVQVPPNPSSIALGHQGDGRLEAFITDSSDGLHHAWQMIKNANVWSSWETFAGTMRSMAVETNSNGRLTLLGLDADGFLHQDTQTVANANSWSGWSDVQGRQLDPVSEEQTPCANDVQASVTEKLRSHGDPMGAYLGGGMPDPEQGGLEGNNHLQGVQRLPADGGRWMAISYDDKGDGPGGVGFAHLSSRSPVEDGGRLRSNRLGSASMADQAPPAADKVVAKVDSGRNDLWHAGGMQALGNYLAVPYEGTAASSEIRFYNVSNPAAPTLMSTLVRTGKSHSGNVGWTRLSDGRYLLMVGANDSQPLDFFTSSNIAGPYTHLATWTGDFPAYQSTNIVTECATGKLFITGSYKFKSSSPNMDLLDVYSLDISAGVTISGVGARHMYCAIDGNRQCDFDAAGGAYVSPAHELYYYSTEHDNDGPSGSIKMMEFRTNTPNGSTCDSNANSSWVELYEDANFGGRSIVIDYPDRGLENYANYEQVESFGDTASSARWCLSPNQTYQLYKDANFSGSSKWLSGRGEDADLGQLPGITGWTDVLSSSRFYDGG